MVKMTVFGRGGTVSSLPSVIVRTIRALRFSRPALLNGVKRNWNVPD